MESKRVMIVEKDSLWSMNYSLIWFGQLVSSLGDAIFEIVIAAWILDSTDSTALMGLIQAATAFPRPFVSPIAGTVVDRFSKKRIIVISDFIRGVAVIVVAIAAMLGYRNIGLFVIVGVILGTAHCFFEPAINSILPEIVSDRNLMKANSGISIIQETSSIGGSAVAGFFYTLLGAPLIMMFNGISFLLSATSETFIQVSEFEHDNKKNTFIQDFKAGLSYVWENKGLKYLYIAISSMNFFGSIGFMLVLPYFKKTSFLGYANYGVSISLLSLGLIVGLAIVTRIEFKRITIFSTFILAGVISYVSMALIPLSPNIMFVFLQLFIFGFGLAITTSITRLVLQKQVSSDMRGKVFGIKSTLSSALIPLALVLGGYFGDIFPINSVITVNYVVIVFIFIIISFVPSIRNFVNCQQ